MIDAATPASNGAYFVGLDARPVASSRTAATSSPASTTAPVGDEEQLGVGTRGGHGNGVPPGPPTLRFVVGVPDRPPFAPVDLFEYQGKQLFAQYGIPVSDGAPVTTVPEAVEVADRIGYPVVVKAQVQVGGRGKAGGIKLAANADEARAHAEAILGMDIKGHVVKVVWIERASDIAEEYYASFTLDRAAKLHLGMLSAQGGVEIEQVAEENPDAIAKIHVDPVDGLTEAQCREWVAAAKLEPRRPPRARSTSC